MAYLLAAFCLFILMAAIGWYLSKSSTVYTQVPNQDLDLIQSCFQEAEQEIAVFLQNAGRVEYMNPVLMQDLGKKIRSKMLLGKSICKQHRRNRV